MFDVAHGRKFDTKARIFMRARVILCACCGMQVRARESVWRRFPRGQAKRHVNTAKYQNLVTLMDGLRIRRPRGRAAPRGPPAGPAAAQPERINRRDIGDNGRR